MLFHPVDLSTMTQAAAQRQCSLQNPPGRSLLCIQNPSPLMQIRQQLYDWQWQQYVNQVQPMDLQPQMMGGRQLQPQVQAQQVQQGPQQMMPQLMQQYVQQQMQPQMQPQWLQSYLLYQGIGDLGRPMI